MIYLRMIRFDMWTLMRIFNYKYARRNRQVRTLPIGEQNDTLFLLYCFAINKSKVHLCLVLFENGFRIFANQKRARIFKNGKTVFE